MQTTACYAGNEMHEVTLRVTSEERQSLSSSFISCAKESSQRSAPFVRAELPHAMSAKPDRSIAAIGTHSSGGIIAQYEKMWFDRISNCCCVRHCTGQSAENNVSGMTQKKITCSSYGRPASRRSYHMRQPVRRTDRKHSQIPAEGSSYPWYRPIPFCRFPIRQRSYPTRTG